MRTNRSKITIAALVVFFLHPLPSRAEPELEFAFKGGPNAATLVHDLRIYRYGFSGGFAGDAQWSLSERFSFAAQVELLYTPRGAEVVLDGISQGGIRQHYLDALLAARPEIWHGHWSGYLLLGGGINILVHADNENAAGLSQDVTDTLRRIDVSLLVGVGVAWHLFPRGMGSIRMGAVSLEARHDQGLIDINPMNDGFKNRTDSLMLGLSFVLGRAPSHDPAPSPAK